ncbi:FimB/Mfa2 family fimbrial subunit [Dysgonomonas sp. ZJ709]|uniref:FimB/Mfa2 family fimbrial subunit n=1 Tax=Dysgonomonas sp. ZJ709 TaxID=2709797 RepID=UPI0013E9BE98|nr:FimB/Mfa2 family fimbrial subunit [Dysgonomonas sp. ZJ709]
MNKIFAFIIASLLFVSCSSDDQSPIDVANEKGITFEVTTVNKAGEGLKAGTPLYSQEAVQHVSRVDIHAFVKNGADYTYVRTYSIFDWADGSTFRRFTVDPDQKVPAGDYKFLAVGRGSDMYTITTFDNTVKFQDVAASIAAAGDESEIFAGSAQAQVLESGTRVSLEITRKVAGVLGYFKNIPETLNGSTVKYLRLSVAATNSQVNLSTGIGSSNLAAVHNLINIDLTGQGTTGGIFNGIDLSGAGVATLPNSQLGGAFIIPISSASLTLGLYDASNVAIKTWVVKSGSATVFDLVANNFYSLGLKTKASTTNGTDPADPNDDDQAIDLLTDETLTITITPTWSTLHNLTLQ